MDFVGFEKVSVALAVVVAGLRLHNEQRDFGFEEVAVVVVAAEAAVDVMSY